jgi:hypothetical protein
MTASDWTALAVASSHAQTFLELWTEYAPISYDSLPFFKANWEAQTTVDEHQKHQGTAALLHRFDGNVGALVRWMGRPHVGAHRDTAHILSQLRGSVPDSDLADLRLLYTQGMPAYVNASSTEANYHTYAAYGNHSSVENDANRALDALIKE